jgi:pantetheine-phosphate adenylyltransferase
MYLGCIENSKLAKKALLAAYSVLPSDNSFLLKKSLLWPHQSNSKAMAEVAVFPGSFDPFTLGHKDIVQRASRLFDKVYVAIGNNTSKHYLLPFESRQHIVEKIFADNGRVEVVGYDELTVALCRKLGARYLVRGLRSGTDFDYERNIALMNGRMNPDIETVFFLSHPDYAGVTATIVREIYRYGADIRDFVPPEVSAFLESGKAG